MLNYRRFSITNENFTESSIKNFLDFLKNKRIEAIGSSKNITDTEDSFTPLVKSLGKESDILQNTWKNLLKKGKVEKIEIDPEITPVAGNINVKSLVANQRNVAEIVIEKLKKYGIVNPFVQKAILSVIGKESNFDPNVSEISYDKTSNNRIRKIFGSRVKDLSDDELISLKKNTSKFWDRVYGSDDPTGNSQKLGNTKTGDGIKYRGRGLNGLTFKSNYKKYSDLLRKNGVSVDLVQSPNSLTDPEIAAEVNALYFLDGLSNPASERKYKNTNPNDFKDFQTALKAVTNANAGWGRNIEGSDDLAKANEFSRKLNVDNLTNLA